MRIAPGLMVIVIGMGLLAAGLTVRFGWEVAAMVVGGVMIAIGVLSVPPADGRP